MAAGNRVEISGKLVELDALRHTPGGVAVIRFRISHESTQIEAETPRRVACEIDGLAFDREARLLATATLGMEIGIQDAPRPREILFALVMGTGGRVHSRLGGLTREQVSVGDGQR